MSRDYNFGIVIAAHNPFTKDVQKLQDLVKGQLSSIKSLWEGERLLEDGR